MWYKRELKLFIGGYFMICAEFERTEEGWRVDAEWRGYGKADIIEVFKMENIDIIKVLDLSLIHI